MSGADASSSSPCAALLRGGSCVLAPLAPRTPHSETSLSYGPLVVITRPPQLNRSHLQPVHQAGRISQNTFAKFDQHPEYTFTSVELDRVAARLDRPAAHAT